MCFIYQPKSNTIDVYSIIYVIPARDFFVCIHIYRYVFALYCEIDLNKDNKWLHLDFVFYNWLAPIFADRREKQGMERSHYADVDDHATWYIICLICAQFF